MKKLFRFIMIPLTCLAAQAFAGSSESSTLTLIRQNSEMKVIIRGDYAQGLFKLLNAVTTEETVDSLGKVTRKGEGIECSQSPTLASTCKQSFRSNGTSSAGLPYVESTDGLPYALFTFSGEKAKKLFNFIDNSADEVPLFGGGKKFLRMGERITCIRFEDKDGVTTSYSCSQNITSDGFAQGPGTDPIVNVGTRELTVNLK